MGGPDGVLVDGMGVDGVGVVGIFAGDVLEKRNGELGVGEALPGLPGLCRLLELLLFRHRPCNCP